MSGSGQRSASSAGQQQQQMYGHGGQALAPSPQMPLPPQQTPPTPQVEAKLLRLAEARQASRRAIGSMMSAYEKLLISEIETMEAELAVELDDMRIKELFVLMDELESRGETK